MIKTWQYAHDGFQVIQVAALRDNYMYMVLPDGLPSAWVIDPADAGIIKNVCSQQQRSIGHIWNTHHHWDHVDGNAELVVDYDCMVHAAECERTRIPSMVHGLFDGDHIAIDDLHVDVLAVPGHTDGHMAFVVGDALFCGDALFSAGCGRLFEGTPTQMLVSLQRLASLPNRSCIYCAHEYTAVNLQFAVAVADSLDDNVYRQHCLKRQSLVEMMRQHGRPSIPVLMAEERLFNPFLQVWHAAFTKEYAAKHGTLDSPLAVFTHLRQWRNDFCS